jgi:hypothetical protein
MLAFVMVDVIQPILEVHHMVFTGSVSRSPKEQVTG